MTIFMNNHLTKSETQKQKTPEVSGRIEGITRYTTSETSHSIIMEGTEFKTHRTYKSKSRSGNEVMIQTLGTSRSERGTGGMG